MRIAQIVCTYPPYYGGMGNVAFQTAGILEKLGHEVVVFTPQYGLTPPSSEEQERVKRLEPSISYGNAAYLPQIKKELADFDLVHLHYPFFGTANMVRKWKLENPKKPLVVTYHMDTRALGWKGLFFKYYAKFWLPRILRSSDCLIGSSFDYIEASDANKIYQENKNKWVELPFGVDIERFQPREKIIELFQQSKLNPELPTVLFVGGMDAAHYFKGIPILLKTIAMLKNQDIIIQVILVGDGEQREEFISTAYWLGVKDQVYFAGQVDDKDLPFVYNLADLLVLPSINQAEAFGMVLLEAMASGVPVIASDLPGVRTVAGDGGMVFFPNDVNALAELILGFFQDANNIADWKIKARQMVEEKYSWEIIGKRLEGIYLGLVEGLKK